MELKPINIQEINKNRFDIYMLFTRHPNINFIAKELHYFSNEENTLLGVILFDYNDEDFNYVLNARDENKQFRAFEIKTDFKSKELAIESLMNSMKWHTAQELKMVDQGAPKQGVKLFNTIVSEDKLHPYFINLKEGKGTLASKNAIIEIANHLDDIDGNFVEQFQSLNGFDARVWELYLFASLIELEFQILRDFNRPDFIVRKDEVEIAIEAVIVGRKNNPPILVKLSPENESIKDIEEKLLNETPLRFGSALYSKLKKEYWNLNHVKDKPLVFAIADFHNDQSMIWSFSALTEYLYGSKQILKRKENGEEIIDTINIEYYIKESGEKIPSGFFFQPDSENISGVLFSATGTLGKFTRMGIQAGLGSKSIIVMRVGDRVNPDPSCSEPLSFSYRVDENGNETWCQGLNLFHNPNAKIPINMDLFPNIGHHKLQDGELVSWTPEFHPYSSMNYKTIFE